MKPALVVMAAGKGSRFGGLKQLEALGPHGETLMDYALFDAYRSGVRQVLLIIRPEIESEFRKKLSPHWFEKFQIDFIFQRLDELPQGTGTFPDRTKPWGTGHAVLAAAPHVHSPLIVMNADDFYGPTAFQRLTQWLDETPTGTPTRFAMVAYPLETTLSQHGSVSRSICELNQDGSLRQMQEYSDLRRAGDHILSTELLSDQKLTGQELVSMNFWGFQADIFTTLREDFIQFLIQQGQDPKAEYSLPAHVARRVQAGSAHVQVLTSEDAWFGVTYQEDKPEAITRIRALIEQGIYPTSLEFPS